ncbi:single-stranded-DNA-specific exonuclease RecJ [Domibacillus epiphyticus]|uniref:Single-stranded-DNA-specific exonuclease RecJ n=1 Tax=Domibacillus epiphyticus TaxID=1714355 RepID=A0A1V2A9T6_9BACI|nr:single-stranded-DNA-specific exonuclease RecJ [Domibacillus epiphyticus]OMP67574.1 single-stranded-DNA-specific exonuclease RecJ [Domibacillus epiphyticus]
MLKSKMRWIVRDIDRQKSEVFAEEIGTSPLAASLLLGRGIDNIEEARAFLFEEGVSFHDPYLLKDMDKAIERIKLAKEQNEPVLVYGDYDADGVSSTSVLMTALRDYGIHAEYYIPNRFTEGYGPNEQAFRNAKEMGFGLIITVDTGISGIHEAQVAKEIGVDLIITDHHEPGPELPEALAIIHPKHPEGSYPFGYLAGVGVAFKVAHALYGYVPEHLLDLAAIGTIADLVPLYGENRLIAKKGILALRQSERPGIVALCKQAGAEQSSINEETVGFTIGPRINAAGRLDDAGPAADLMMTDDMDEALMLAEEIDAMNKERQSIVNEMTKEAVEIVNRDFPPDEYPVIIVGKEGWNPGVVGIVASRLTDTFYRPSIVLGFDSGKGIAKGSARSIKGFDLFQSLSTCRDILPHFGGHPMAAGMTLSIDDVDELRMRMVKIANETLTEDDFTPVINVDAEAELADVTIQAIEDLDKLAPFGMNNPKPLFYVKDAKLAAMKKIGGNQTHLKVSLEQDGQMIDGVGFGMGDYADQIAKTSEVSVIGELSINEWNNVRRPQFILRDMRVDEYQLFDMRGGQPASKWYNDVPESRMVISFSEESADPSIITVKTMEEASALSIDEKNVVFLDLPEEESVIKALLIGKRPARIYAHFHSSGGHFFSTMPARDHFKWYYAFLLKSGLFDVKNHGELLAKKQGWSYDAIRFMSKVFFELGFVKINDGKIEVQKDAVKRELSESPAYSRKQTQYELEQKLLYSSYRDLKNVIDEWIKQPAAHREEINR